MVLSAQGDGLLRDRRAIIDRRAVEHRIDSAIGRGMSAGTARAHVLEILREALAGGREEVRERLQAGASGSTTVRANCFLADQLLRVVYDHVSKLYPLANPSKGEILSLVAVGGYGREELAPFSDIDLWFLLPYKITPRTEQVIEATLYFLWDLGLKVGQATRSIDECIRQAKADMTVRTSLLEARFLWGDQPLFLELKRRFRSAVQSGSDAEFIEAKLAERDERHRRSGFSRYALEPNIKDGKGGLRDLHTLYWIAKYLYRVDNPYQLIDRGVFTQKEVLRFSKAQDFLLALRCHLHYLAGRSEERLTFELQPELARKMGYTAHAGTTAVERFMKHYFLVAKDVGSLTRIFCAALETEHKRRSRFRLLPRVHQRRVEGFQVEGDRLTVEGPEAFEDEPVRMLRLFHVAQRRDLDVHPQALRWITQNLKRIDEGVREDKEANEIFLDMLTSPKDPELALRRLNEAGVFGRFIPDFGRVVAQMQFDMYHHYTVDEHTILAIGVLHRIEQGFLNKEMPIASSVVNKVISRRVLYLAVLLHDIAKGRGGDHSELGAEVARTLCPRLGLSAEETETVAWLVLHHLAMSETAFKRDIEDPKTVQDFADLVQSLERLRLLLVLTVADIRAVGPHTWNAWKAALLRDLYWKTEELLAGGFATEGRETWATIAQEALRAKLSDWSEVEIDAYIARTYSSYWLSFDLVTHIRHANLIRRADRARVRPAVDVRVDRYRDATEVTVYTPDESGLFSRIAGALAVSSANIDAAKIFTLTDGMALDTFWVRGSDGRPFERPERLSALSTSIERALSGDLLPMQELKRRKAGIPSRLDVFQVAPRVLIDNKASAEYTVLEVNGRDRPGLLYEITLALHELELQIHSAIIATYGEHVVDVFYIRGHHEAKIDDDARLRRIRARLLSVLDNATSKLISGGAERGFRKRRDSTRRGPSFGDGMSTSAR